MNDLIRPSLYDAYHPIEIVGARDRAGSGASTSSGRSASPATSSRAAANCPCPSPATSSPIGYAGAYGRVMASTYNARPLCAEVLVEGGRWRLTREPGVLEDLVLASRAGSPRPGSRPDVGLPRSGDGRAPDAGYSGSDAAARTARRRAAE